MVEREKAGEREAPGLSSRRLSYAYGNEEGINCVASSSVYLIRFPYLKTLPE